MKIGTLTTEDVCFQKSLIELQGNSQIVQCLIEHAETSVAPSTSQMELSCGLLFFTDGHIEVSQRLIESMKLKVEETSEEKQTCLLLLLAAALDCDVEEFESLLDLFLLLEIINEFGRH
jgi:hypothetical protein